MGEKVIHYKEKSRAEPNDSTLDYIKNSEILFRNSEFL